MNKEKIAIYEELIETIDKLDKYGLEDDGACGDPECCGERSYFIGKQEDGEYIKISDLKGRIEELKKDV